MGRIMLAICGWTALVAIAACVMPVASADQTPNSAAEDFATLCAPCHGTTGRGDGPRAATLPKAPADLTTLSEKNGGKFPMAHVMVRMWGYANGTMPGDMMPMFGPILDSAPVMFDAGDGIATPVPKRMVDLAKYLVTLQR